MLLKKSYIFKKANAVVSSLFSYFVDIVDFRKEQTQQVKVLKKATVFRPSFLNFHSSEKPYWINFTAIEGSPHFVIPIENATLISKGIVIDEDGKVILENCIFQREYLDELFSNHLIKLRRFLPSRNVGKVISLLNRLDNNYFHWATESLTRILLVHQLPEFSSYKIVIKSGSQPFIKESLSFLFNVEEEQIIEKPLSQVLKTKETMVVSFPHVRKDETQWTNVYDPSVLQNLNTLALKRIKEQSIYRQNHPQCILISRKNATERRMINEEEVLSSLESYGVEVVYLEMLPYLEQVALFSKAKVIIGVHGAGLTNCLYCENATLIEYFPEKRNIRDGFYFTQITGAIQMPHHFITYEDANAQGDLLMTKLQINDLKNRLDTLI